MSDFTDIGAGLAGVRNSSVAWGACRRADRLVVVGGADLAVVKTVDDKGDNITYAGLFSSNFGTPQNRT